MRRYFLIIIVGFFGMRDAENNLGGKMAGRGGAERGRGGKHDVVGTPRINQDPSQKTFVTPNHPNTSMSTRDTTQVFKWPLSIYTFSPSTAAEL